MIVNSGMNALQLVFEIIKSNSLVSSVHFAIYKPTLGFKARIEKADPKLARKLNSGTSSDIPMEIYWNHSLLKKEQALVLRELLYHDSIDEFKRRTKLDIRDFTPNRMHQVISSLADNQTLAICSNCDMKDGSTSHIPMMDFACEIKPYNLELIKRLIRLLGLNGAILESGKSYHFYGFELMSHQNWLELMAKFLLAAPLTDLRYIAHRILGQACILRITPNALKPTTPTVKAIINSTR